MPRPSYFVTLSTWLLPVAVATAGFGVHFALHVPPGPLPPPSPAKVEEDRKAADRKKKEEERKRKEEERKAGKKTPKADRGPKEFPYEPFTAPRKPYLLSQLWEYYGPTDFKKEPTFDAWQTAHKPIIAQIVQLSRQVGFVDPPAISVSSSECHTIRCRFSLSSADQEPLDQLIEHLRALQIDGASLWHDFDASAPAVDKKDAAKRLKSQVTVSFMRDLPPLASITLPGKGNLSVAPKPAPVPTTPSAPPTAPPTTPTGTVPPIKSGGAAPSTFPTPSGAPLRESPQAAPRDK